MIILNYNNDRKDTQLVDKRYTNSFTTYISLPTRIIKHSETIIDNIFYNKIIPDLLSRNITTGMFDHLIQFLIEPPTFSENNEKTITHDFVLGNSVKKTLKYDINQYWLGGTIRSEKEWCRLFHELFPPYSYRKYREACSY